MRNAFYFCLAFGFAATLGYLALTSDHVATQVAETQFDEGCLYSSNIDKCLPVSLEAWIDAHHANH